MKAQQYKRRKINFSYQMYVWCKTGSVLVYVMSADLAPSRPLENSNLGFYIDIKKTCTMTQWTRTNTHNSTTQSNQHNDRHVRVLLNSGAISTRVWSAVHPNDTTSHRSGLNKAIRRNAHQVQLTGAMLDVPLKTLLSVEQSGCFNVFELRCSAFQSVIVFAGVLG